MRKGTLVVIGISAVPVIIWSLMLPLDARFGSSSSAKTSIGQLSGLLGIALFATSLMLSARIKLFDRLFLGMNTAYKQHHVIGGISLVLLLLHPIALAATYYAVSAKAAAEFLLPGGDLATTLGSAALSLMILLLVLTFFARLAYPLWKSTHRFLGVAFILASLHVLLISSDVSRSWMLRSYMVLLIVLASCAWVYRGLLGDLLVMKHRYIVEDVRLRNEVTEITMKPARKPVVSSPGQFIFVSFRQRGLEETHPFSISSLAEGKIRISAKALGDYTKGLSGIKKGTEAMIEGAYGGFVPGNREMVWIAGGIEITPFLAMAGTGRKATLFYSVKKESEAVYLEELRKHRIVKTHLHVAEKDGFLTAEKVMAKEDIQGKDIYICGPPPMMASLKRQFLKLGVPRERIHTEEFGLE